MSNPAVQELTAEAAFKELRNVSWPMLLIALGVDDSFESKLADEHQGDDAGAMRSLLKHWTNNHEETTWKTLAEALMSLPPFRRRGTYVYNKYVNPECFTAEKIAEEMNFIEDWFRLAHPFLDDSDRVREAVSGDVTVEDRRKKVMEAWLRYYDVPSWDEVANIVEDCFPEHRDKAENIRKKYLPKVEFLKPEQMARKQPPLEKLDSKNAFTETSDITDWFALGWFLGIPEEELEEIQNNHPRTDDRRQAVLDYWLETNQKTASWISLAEAIGKMRPHGGLSRALKQRAQKLKQEEGTVETTQTSIEEEMEVTLTEEEPAAAPPATEKNIVISAEKVEELTDGIGAIQITVQRIPTDDKDSIRKINAALDDVKKELKQLTDVSAERQQEEEIAEEETPQEIDTSSVPESVLRTMSIISETEMTFTSSEDASLDWNQYGLRMHIKKGSIPKGEKGVVHVYAIYSGPYQLPKELQLASAVYYISVSHDLDFCTLELQHNNNAVEDEEGNPLLTFMSVRDARAGPPYAFDPIPGGYFNVSTASESNYGMIRRNTFSLYGIGRFISNKIKSLLWSFTSYQILWSLTAKNLKNWNLRLALIEDLNAYMKHYRRKEKYLVENDRKKIALTEKGFIEIAVSTEEEGAPIKAWKGYEMAIVSKWKIVSMTQGTGTLQLCPDDIDKANPSSHLDISINWSAPRGNRSRPTNNSFRIHFLEIAKPLNILIRVPQPFHSTVSSDLSSGSTEPDIITDPPTEQVFLDRVMSKLIVDTIEFATYLLTDEHSRIEFRSYVKSTSNRNVRKEGIELFLIWQKSNKNFTWKHVIRCLKNKEGLNDARLGKALDRCYESSVFVDDDDDDDDEDEDL